MVPVIVTVTVTRNDVPNSGVVKTYFMVPVWSPSGQKSTLPAMTLPSLLNAFAARFKIGISMIRPTRIIAMRLTTSNTEILFFFLVVFAMALPNPLSCCFSGNKV